MPALLDRSGGGEDSQGEPQLTTPDPKPAARIVATREEWDRIIDLKDGPCRAGTKSHWVDYAHLVPKGMDGTIGGDDVPENIIPVGHEAHMIWTDRGKGWEHIGHRIRASLTADELAYVIRKKGEDWLEQNYPSGDTGPLCAKCRKPVKAGKNGGTEKPRPRKTLTIRVPDDAENGSVIFKELVAACGERLADALGYTEATPSYYVLTAVMAHYLQEAA